MGRLARVGDVAPLSRAGPLRGASHRFVTGRLAQFRSEGHLARLRCRGTSRVRCGVPRTGSLRGQLRSAPSRASPHGPSASTGRRSHRSGEPIRILEAFGPAAGCARFWSCCPRPSDRRKDPASGHRLPSSSSLVCRAHRASRPHPRRPALLERVRFLERVRCAGIADQPPRTACHPHVHQTHQLPRPSGLPAPLGAFSLGGNKLFRSSAARRRAPSGRVASPRRTSRTDAHA